MKKSISLLILSIGLLFYTQAQDIAGNWQVDLDQSIEAMATAQRLQYDSMSIDTQSQIHAQLESQYFNLQSDGRFSIGSTGGESYQGQWSMLPDTLELTYDIGAKMKRKLSIPNKSTLILELIQNPNSTALIHRIVLVPSE